MGNPAWYTDPSWNSAPHASGSPEFAGNVAMASPAVSKAEFNQPSGSIQWNQTGTWQPHAAQPIGGQPAMAAPAANYSYAQPLPPQSSHPAPHGYVKYVPVGYSDTHSVAVGYALWLVGFLGAHRFYYGKPITGILWFLTFGLFGIGWLVDAFLIPSMDREADRRYRPGRLDYNVGWLLLVFGGFFGLHRFYQGKILSGVLYLLTGGFFVFGFVYDILTLNTQIDHTHATNENPIYH